MTVESLLKPLRGMYRDRLYDPHGQLLWDRDWHSNVIVVDCHRLLAGFMLGSADTLGIQALYIGAGQASWDVSGTPAPQSTDTTLSDTASHAISSSELDIDFLETTSDATSALPTNRIQIRATLGPNIPPWPDADHETSTLREFGLVGQLAGSETLINYVRHPAIVKDPASTLERTIWLIF